LLVLPGFNKEEIFDGGVFIVVFYGNWATPEV